MNNTTIDLSSDEEVGDYQYSPSVSNARTTDGSSSTNLSYQESSDDHQPDHISLSSDTSFAESCGANPMFSPSNYSE